MDDNKLILYTTDDGEAKVALISRDGTLWLNQNQLAKLFSVSKSTISEHLTNIFSDNELDKALVVKQIKTVAEDNKEYLVNWYSLAAILSVGFRVRNKQGVQFRQWANKNLQEYMVKGFVIDDHRLKNPDGRPDYFDELLARIRDIRASEKRFYQKIRDLFALSSDYDREDQAVKLFFAETQNKLLYAVTKQTAAEIITSRVDSQKPNMGLTNWQGSVVRKQDIHTAKNYLDEREINILNRLVVIF